MMDVAEKILLKVNFLYDRKADAVGIVIETGQGIKCQCASKASDTPPAWVSGD